MSTDHRLDKLYPRLTAKERAILILRAWKAGEDEDPKVRNTIPDKQTYPYNRLIALMRGASGDLSHYIVLVAQLVNSCPSAGAGSRASILAR